MSDRMVARRIQAPPSVPVYLDPDQPLRRLPRRPELERPEKFMAQFEDRALFYDIFRARKGRRVYMLGPIELNLAPHFASLRITGHPSGKTVRLTRIPFVAYSLFAWVNLPAGDTELSFEFAGQFSRVPISANHCDLFAGDRVVFTINQNNELRWIADWAEFYVKEHGATAAVIYDNCSDQYSVADIEAALAGVPGLKKFMVVPWDYPFGASDPARTARGRQWARFAQPVLFTQFMHRFAHDATSLVNADIDELVVSSKRRSIFKAVENARFGLIKYHSRPVVNITEKNAADTRHCDYLVCKKEFRINPAGFKKWAMAPARLWLRGLPVLPVVHNVLHLISGGTTSDEFINFHFNAITSGWRARRATEESSGWGFERELSNSFDKDKHERVSLLGDVMGEVFGSRPCQERSDTGANP